MDGWVAGGWVGGWMGGWVDGWVGGWMDTQKHAPSNKSLLGNKMSRNSFVLSVKVRSMVRLARVGL